MYTIQQYVVHICIYTPPYRRTLVQTARDGTYLSKSLCYWMTAHCLTIVTPRAQWSIGIYADDLQSLTVQNFINVGLAHSH